MARSREGRTESDRGGMCNPFCVLKPIGLGAQSGNLAFRLGGILSLNFDVE